jgi:hypothetical protein
LKHVVRGVTAVTGIQTRKLLVIFCGVGDEHNLRSVLAKERLQIKMLEVALVTPVYSTSTVTVFVFLTPGKQKAYEQENVSIRYVDVAKL